MSENSSSPTNIVQVFTKVKNGLLKNVWSPSSSTASSVVVVFDEGPSISSLNKSEVEGIFKTDLFL